jgi:hypothetical protein
MLPRLFKLEPAAVGAGSLAVYAAASMVYSVVTHTGVFDPDVFVAGGGALWSLYTRLKVTPLAAPKAANHVRLVPIDQTPRHGPRL